MSTSRSRRPIAVFKSGDNWTFMCRIWGCDIEVPCWHFRTALHTGLDHLNVHRTFGF